MVNINNISDSSINDLAGMAEVASLEGYLFIRRFIDHWNSNEQRFSGIGEGFWGLFLNEQLIGVGGLSLDPYIDNKQMGRLRHLYILPKFRNNGYGKMIVNHILSQAQKHFKSVRLFTENPRAAAFYEQLGFQPVLGHKVTHLLIYS